MANTRRHRYVVSPLMDTAYWSSEHPHVTISKPKVFPKKLPSTSQVLRNLNKARDLLTKFDECIKRKTTLSPHEIGSWEQSDIKGAFKADVIPFSENLKETFKLFEKGFITEVKEMKDIFEQMEDEIIEIILWYLDSGCSKHMTGHRDKLMNIVSKFIGTVRFGNDHFAAIMGYGDLQMGNILISRVYYVKGLGHNIFFVSSNLYTISMADMMKSSLICLLSQTLKIKYWLWHRRLSYLNFGTINQLVKQGLVKGLPKLKHTKDHLCSVCQMGKSKKESYLHKHEPSTNEKLQMMHMDLCGSMRVESINKKIYILVIVDDYSRFTWVKFLRTKDEAPETIIKFLKQAQVSLNATVRYLRTDNGTEFINQTLQNYKEEVGITHTTSTARTSQQNGVVKRRNCTLVEAARTMLIFSKSKSMG
ncbi:retrovirus-related pol polyprotein from transposon TNT 1-94 [Tanacetum coccineum]